MRTKLVAWTIVGITLLLFPWSGAVTGCSLRTSGSGDGCVTQYISPLGFLYPEWLGAVFYLVLVFLVGWVVLTPFRRIEPTP